MLWMGKIYQRSSLPNSKIFALAKKYWHKSKINKLASTTVLNMSTIKVVDVNVGYNSKMADHISNSTFVLKFVSGNFHI